MKKYLVFSVLASTCLVSVSLYAYDLNCDTQPTCEDLGYKMTANDCPSASLDVLKCPFDASKLFCHKIPVTYESVDPISPPDDGGDEPGTKCPSGYNGTDVCCDETYYLTSAECGGALHCTWCETMTKAKPNGCESGFKYDNPDRPTKCCPNDYKTGSCGGSGNQGEICDPCGQMYKFIGCNEGFHPHATIAEKCCPDIGDCY